MILDLEKHKLLDKTLIVVGTEFGRSAAFDGGGERGHQSSTFFVVWAGGGLKHTGAYGVTDDRSKEVVEKPVSVPALFATIHSAMGISTRPTRQHCLRDQRPKGLAQALDESSGYTGNFRVDRDPSVRSSLGMTMVCEDHYRGE